MIVHISHHITKFRNPVIPSIGQDMGKQRSSYAADEGVNS